MRTYQATMRIAASLPLLLAVSLLACGDKKSSASGDSSGSAKDDGSAAPKSSVPKANPDEGFTGPALGAADAIEPPSRDILPGMSVKQAKDKGAKAGDVDYMLKFRPDTELWISKEMQIVESLQVEYPAKDWEGIKAKWGKPTISDDVWVGANFVAKLNGCANGPCGVTFTRLPQQWLGDKPFPPGTLGNLKPGMTAEEVKTATGFALSEGPGISNGFGWDLYVSYDGDKKLDELDLDAREGEADYWEPILTKRWGAPQEVESKKVWLNADANWGVQFDYAGTLLRFKPMKSVKKLLSKSGDDGVLAIAKATVGKKHGDLKDVKGFDVKNEQLTECRMNEYAFMCPSVSLELGDEDKVKSLEIRFSVEDDAAAAKLIKDISDAWGATTKKKNDADEEIQTVSVDGFEASILSSGSVRVTLTKK